MPWWVPFPRNAPVQVAFDRAELMRILDLYGRMVAAGLWRDYAIGFEREAAHFSAYKRSAERPSARIEKRPDLRQRQGMWALYGEAGQVLKRGHDSDRGAGIARAQADENRCGLAFCLGCWCWLGAALRMRRIAIYARGAPVLRAVYRDETHRLLVVLPDAARHVCRLAIARRRY